MSDADLKSQGVPRDPLSPRLARMKPAQLNEVVHFGPLLLLDSLKIEPLPAAIRDRLLLQARSLRAPGLSRLTGGRSFNAEQVHAATCLWYGDGVQQGAAWNFFVDYYLLQLGHREPNRPLDPAEGSIGHALGEIVSGSSASRSETDLSLLRFYGGNEQNSPTYEGWRAEADAAVYIWALDNGDETLRALALESILVRGAISSLMSSTRPAINLQTAKNKRLFQDTRFYSPVGERGVGHDLTPMAIIAEALRDQPYNVFRVKDPEVLVFEAACKRIPIEVRNAVPDPLHHHYLSSVKGAGMATDAIAYTLRNIRFKQRQSIYLWSDCHVCVLWEHTNTNSATVMASKYTPSTRIAELLYPFGSGRQFKSGTARSEKWRSDIQVYGPTSPMGEMSFDIPLDSDRPAGWPREIVLGPSGLEVIA